MSQAKGEKYLPYLYVAPAVILMVFLTLLPNIYSFFLSFTNYSLYHFKEFQFVGLRNYWRIVSGAELKTFITVFAWTLVWSGASVMGMVTVGMLLAIPLNNRHLKWKNFYRTLFIIPWAIPAFITVLMWQGILNSDLGAMNMIIREVRQNLPIADWVMKDLFHITGGIDWLENAEWAKVSVLIVNIWLGFPFMMSMCLGALQAIPCELYEAASVDGAPPAKQFFSITIPLLRGAMLPVLISSFAFNFNQFGSIYLLTGGGPTVQGMKAGATDILVTYSYKLAFNLFQFGQACAYAVFIFAIIAALSSANFRLTGAFEDR
jgi:arabinogalactan oligomer/maltooligosaccharide transport system permease protein